VDAAAGDSISYAEYEIYYREMLTDLRKLRVQLRRIELALGCLRCDAVALGADPNALDLDLGLATVRAKLEDYKDKRRAAIRCGKHWRAADRRGAAPAIHFRAAALAYRSLDAAATAFDNWYAELDRVWFRFMKTADFVIDTYAYDVEELCADPADGRPTPPTLH